MNEILKFITEINHLMIMGGWWTMLGLFMWGACVGSFFNVVIARWPLMEKRDNLESMKDYLEELKFAPHKEINETLEKNNKISLSFPRSHCFSCKTNINWYDNIPLLSWLLLRGKCRACQVSFSSKYLLTEVATGFLFSLVWFLSKDLNSFAWLWIVFVAIGWILMLVDAKTMLIPDKGSYTLLWLGLGLAALNIHPAHLSPQEAIFGALGGYVMMSLLGGVGWLIKRQQALGYGDYKLMAAIGAWIGFKGAAFTLLASPILGIIGWCFIYFSTKDKSNDQPIPTPFGPALVLTSWVYLYYGDKIIAMINS